MENPKNKRIKGQKRKHVIKKDNKNSEEKRETIRERINIRRNER